MLKGVKAFLLVLDFLLYVQKCRWFDSLAHRERNRQVQILEVFGFHFVL